MLKTVKMFLTPRWVGLHLFVWCAAVGMILLGRWQLRVSDAKHFDLQNFGYALQWWAFSACAVAFWLKVLRDARRGGGSLVASTGNGQLVVRGGRVAPMDGTHVGPTDLVARPDRPDQAPVAYRGYLMPQSRTSPARSEGDRVHASYNDYLWQLGLADSAGRSPSTARTPSTERTPFTERTQPSSAEDRPAVG